MAIVDASAVQDSVQIKSRAKYTRSDTIAALVFLSPWIVGILAIVAGPLLASLYFSFTDYAGYGVAQWVGFDNYIRALTADPRFWNAARVTGTYVLVSVPLVVVFALLLAVLLSRGIAGLTLYRAVFYVPSLIGGSVAIALLWRRVFGAEGLVNSALQFIGIDYTTSWIGAPSTALTTLIILHVWQFGSAMIIFLAGLRQIPRSLYEAAEIDGANKVQRFFTITLPMLSPLILFNTVMNTIGSFQAFNSAYVISGGSGGPADSTLFYTLYLYQKGFVNFEMGYASALGWMLIIAIGTSVAALILLSRKYVFYGEDL